MEVSGQLHAHAQLPLGKEPINGRLGEAPKLAWTLLENRKIFCACHEMKHDSLYI
jgi:hypothetical protein